MRIPEFKQLIEEITEINSRNWSDAIHEQRQGWRGEAHSRQVHACVRQRGRQVAAGARQFRSGRHAAIGGHGPPTRSPLSGRGLAFEFSLNDGDATLWGISRISSRG